jgi:hypothetical protein
LSVGTEVAKRDVMTGAGGGRTERLLEGVGLRDS